MAWRTLASGLGPSESSAVTQLGCVWKRLVVVSFCLLAVVFLPAVRAETGTEPSTLNSQPLRSTPSINSFNQLSTLKIVTDPRHLFSRETGIYTHPTERGEDWERAVTLEVIDAEGRRQFQVGCGLRIHGGMSRQPEETPKHSFRLIFSSRHGSTNGPFPWFGPEDAREYEELILRAGNNDSWLFADGEQRGLATYIRDEWMRRSMLAMGHRSARGAFVNLYLNGMYWGLYNLCEPAGRALFAGKERERTLEFDTRKGEKMQSGDSAAWDRLAALADSGLSDEERYQEISKCIDLPQFADYLILNFYAGNSDWDRSGNWVAVRPRIPGGRFQFLVWDAECILGSINANTMDFDDEDSPPHLFQKLSENAAFRKLFAERAQRLLFDQGALAPEVCAERFRDLANQVGKAMTAEAARWGNYRRDVHPFKSGPYERYTVEEHWQPEVDRIVKRFFPQRREILLKQFRDRGLFPTPASGPEQ